MGNTKSTSRYEERVEAEAKRRIYLQNLRKELLAERQKFEEDVAERMALARNPAHMTREMLRQEEITRNMEETARTMDARLREQEKQKMLEERAKAHEERQKRFQENFNQQQEVRRQAAEQKKQEAIRQHEERVRKMEEENERKKKEEAELAEKAEKERLEFERDMKTYVDSVLEMMRAGVVYVSEYKPDTPERHEEVAKLERYRKDLEEVARQDFFANKEDPAVFRYIVDYMARVTCGVMYGVDDGENHVRACNIGKIVECPSFGIVGVARMWGQAHEWNYKWLRHHHISYCGGCKSCVFARDTSVFQ